MWSMPIILAGSGLQNGGSNYNEQIDLSNNSVEGGLQNEDGNNSKLQANTLGVDNNRTSCEIAILGKLEMDVEMGIVKTRITRFYLQNRANNRNIN